MGDVFDEPDGLEMLAWTKKGARCERCRIDVPFVERELYADTGLCGWCAHHVAKDPDCYWKRVSL